MRNRKIYLSPNDSYEKFYLAVKGLKVKFLLSCFLLLSSLVLYSRRRRSHSRNRSRTSRRSRSRSKGRSRGSRSRSKGRARSSRSRSKGRGRRSRSHSNGRSHRQSRDKCERSLDKDKGEQETAFLRLSLHKILPTMIVFDVHKFIDVFRCCQIKNPAATRKRQTWARWRITRWWARVSRMVSQALLPLSLPSPPMPPSQVTESAVDCCISPLVSLTTIPQ